MGHLRKIVKEFKSLKEQVILKFLYKNDLEKSCFAHDAAYSDRKDLAKRAITDKILRDAAYEIDKIMMDIIEH